MPWGLFEIVLTDYEIEEIVEALETQRIVLERLGLSDSAERLEIYEKRLKKALQEEKDEEMENF